MKTPVLEDLFNKVTIQVFFCEYCEIFKNTYYEKHLCGCFCNDPKAKKKILLLPEMWVTKKIFTRAAAIFLINFTESFKQSLH